MKTVSLTMAMLLIMITCHAEKFRTAKNVPASVITAAQKQYAQVHINKWEKSNDTFIARFTVLKKKECAFYTADGTWIKTETKIPWSWKLPATVKSSFDKTVFTSWYIDEMKEIASPGKDVYVIQVHHSDAPAGAIPGDYTDVYKLSFDINGTLVKKEGNE